MAQRPPTAATEPAGEPASSRRAPPGERPRRRDERGGAVSLWVVLMVPVSAFAAVVAMAGPQRLAAESSVQEATDDLAVFAVAWRDGQQTQQGLLPAFPPDCVARTPVQETEFAALQGLIALLSPTDPNLAALITQYDTRLDLLLMQFWLPLPAVPPVTIDELRDKRDDFHGSLDAWERACESLAEAVVRDLGYLGMDVGSLRGFYSDSLETSGLAAAAGTEVPCWTSQPPAGQAMVVRDAVHVALAARWQDAGWAAAQVWPDGLPMAAESVGRLSQRDPVPPADQCDDQFDVLDSFGRPVWAGNNPAPDSRQLAESVPRRPLAG